MKIEITNRILYKKYFEIQPGKYISNSDGEFIVDAIDKRLFITGKQGAEYNDFANKKCKFSLKEYEVHKLVELGYISLILNEKEY